jgi:hypothetical protein
MSPVAGEQVLNALERCRVDEPLVKPIVELVVMADLPDVDRVRKQIVEAVSSVSEN